ncbi:SAM-dependent methyltransferase [Streptosporangium becharense]|uniref:SAM-dependent methyltransferase n=1 Tax=Streptosporangium becharense TaxID=1816182 RepID=A0A7W9MIW8_9ACTN|nr:methyltransferase [Streptosporangium becharense]MBB2911048.1 SAM-dependent methyltransferase [Streptosporangium becharense]MBB5821894.1 SAM-dependent methyltransferase [Streptosporangium becharense]
MNHENAPGGRVVVDNLPASGLTTAGGPRAATGEIEDVLAGHDQVAQAVVVPWPRAGEGTGPPAAGDGTRLVAYVVPTPDAAGGEALADAQVDEWQQIYDRLYGASPSTALGDNFAGWNSSYDRRPIDLDEMRKWRSATVERVLELGPRRVLEIGAGSGLLLSRIAPECESYWATDLSPVAVDDLARHVGDDPRLAGRVTLRAQGADRVDGLPAGYFDTVVVNSVVQLFPGPRYLATVIDRALTLLAPGGALFLGDIRDLRTVEYLRAAVALHRDDGADADAVVRAARRSRAREEELLVHPGYFTALADAHPAVAGIDIQLKRGDYHNELSRHRYDVVLHKAPAAVEDVSGCRTLGWGTEVKDIADLAGRLAATTPPVRVTGIPNARLTGETAAWRALAEGDAARARRLLTRPAGDAADARTPDPHAVTSQAAGSHTPGPHAAGPHALDPHALTDVAARTGLHVSLVPDLDRPDRFEAVFTRPHRTRTALTGTCRPASAAPRDLTEIPAVTHRADALTARLRAWLDDRLPAHLVPAAVVTLDALPRRPDGTVDRGSLPEPGPADPAARRPPTPPGPRTEADRTPYPPAAVPPHAVPPAAEAPYRS